MRPLQLGGCRRCNRGVHPTQANERVQRIVAGQLVLKRETPEFVVVHACR